MENIFLQRLSVFAKEIKCLSVKCLDLCHSWKNENLEAARITASKLQSILNRFNTELYQYFNVSKDPNADEISTLTSVQLEGEETLAEINTKIKINSPLTTENSQNYSSASTSKLPELHLPQFRGDVLEWHQFWDQFSSNIDQRNLRDVDKLLYLKASLKGEAKITIDGLETTNSNYNIAVSTLKERYGKEDQVIDAHYSTLYRLKKAENAEDCRKTLNEIERHLRVLQSLGENTNHNHLRFLIMEKFPKDVIYEMKMKTGTESIEEMRKQLATIISAREDANRITVDNNLNDSTSYTVETLHVHDRTKKDKGLRTRNVFDSTRYNRNKGIDNKFRSNVSTFNTANIPKKRQHDVKGVGNQSRFFNKRRKVTCIFCQEFHYNDECNKIKTIEERKLKLKNRCFNCFQVGHLAIKCKNKRNCTHCGKYGLHNRALCPKRLGKVSESINTLHVTGKGSTVLQTAVVNVREGNILKKCRILLDSGSQRSYVTQRTAKDLNLSPEEENHLSIFTFGSKIPHEIDSPLVKLNIETRTNNFKSLFVNVVPSITDNIPCLKYDFIDNNYTENYVLADDGTLSDIDILIGNDYYYSLMSTTKLKIEEDLYLIESELGWILSGKLARVSNDVLSVVTYFQSFSEIRLNQPDLPLDNGNLKILWDLETIGITDSPMINRDEEAIKNFNETTTFENNRYFVSWPWNEYPPELQSNFGLAYGRLVSLLKRLNLETLLVYNQTLNDQLDSGIIELVPTENIVNHPVHYLPHHGVSTPEKSIRIVYDASAKVKNNKSLNECLYCGPMMLEDLTGLLLKFRCHAVGVTADVEKAFLQIGLQESDRDVTRFLWLKDITRPPTKENILQLRFTRVPFGIISSPFLLNATIKHHLLKSENESVRKLANDIYVDNLITGTNNTQEALDLYKSTKEQFQQISMNLREWSCNSKEFMCLIPDTCQDNVVKILGLNWELNDDKISLRFNTKINAYTKRGILKSISSIYDPCGFTVPTVLPAKILLQDLWKTKTKWDTKLSKEMIDKWKIIQNDLQEIKEIVLQRCYIKDPKNKDCKLHCFTDASTKAYAAVVYIVQENEKNFVIGKSRLVPIKDQANLKIPRLELLGVLIGSRLIQYVMKFLHLNVIQQILWTDSQIVIDWHNSNKLLTPFVSRRIEEIKLNKNLEIRYVPSGLNPADVATRPISSKEERSRWLNGPSFLLKKPTEWPNGPVRSHTLFSGEDLPNNEKESQMEHNEIMEVEINTDINCQNPQINCNEIIDQQKTEKHVKIQNHGTIEEIMNIQLKHFSDEINGKETNLSRNLGLFKDIDGILRCKGRLKYASWSFDKRYPILLPKNCEFTSRIIKNTHEKNYHVGVNHTLSIIRESFWIPQGKSQVQKILRKCPRCVKHGGGPFQLPSTPALPIERVNFSSPFTFTGVDYLGPVLIKTGNGTCKRWICLFTCLAIRAIHLEVIQDLTAEEGLLALRRMISTRGVPTLVTSDNATHFKLISEIISKPYCVENKIQWKFIPTLAPWFGGFYERLVAMVKHCMKRTLEKHLLGKNQLITIVKEIEAIINTRPLTCVDNELEHILKPSDFLNIGKCITMESADEERLVEGTTTKVDLIKSWKKALMILEEFKEMFKNRYLPSLRERYNHSHKEPRVTSKEIPKEGQIVQLKGDKNREGWKVGKIISLVQSADGLCRVAKVKVGDSIFTRSIAHLYPLEVDEGTDKTEYMDKFTNTDTNKNESVQISNSTNEKQTRSAAVRAREKIKGWTRNLLTTLL